MPRAKAILGSAVNEDKWSRAKGRAEEEGKTGNWGYVMDIYKKMMHLGEFTHKNIAYRKKKKMKVPEWREKKNYSPKQYHKPAEVKKSSSIDNGSAPVYNNNMKLILAGNQEMDEFRCGNCKRLLFKGINLHKSMIEVKCSHCGTLNINW